MLPSEYSPQNSGFPILSAVSIFNAKPSLVNVFLHISQISSVNQNAWAYTVASYVFFPLYSVTAAFLGGTPSLFCLLLFQTIMKYKPHHFLCSREKETQNEKEMGKKKNWQTRKWMFQSWTNREEVRQINRPRWPNMGVCRTLVLIVLGNESISH